VLPLELHDIAERNLFFVEHRLYRHLGLADFFRKMFFPTSRPARIFSPMNICSSRSRMGSSVVWGSRISMPPPRSCDVDAQAHQQRRVGGAGDGGEARVGFQPVKLGM